MRSVLFLCSMTGLMAGLVSAAPACGGHGDRNTMLVTTAWLAEHLKDPNLVVLAVGDDGDYGKGHIPGSVFVR